MTSKGLLSFAVLFAFSFPSHGASLQLVDDRGQALGGETVELCFTVELEQRCQPAPPGGRFEWPADAATVRIEGERHGPVQASRPRDGATTVTVARKARAVVSGLAGARSELSLYPLDDPLFRRPSQRLDLRPAAPYDGPVAVWLPADEHLVSVARPGLAPHLQIVDAPPGGRVEIRTRPRRGWSLVVRSVGPTGEPVSGARVVVEDAPPGEAAPSRAARWTAQTDRHGLAVISGLTAALAQAVVTHPDYLPADLYGLASPAGSFGVRTVDHTQGARVEATVLVHGEPAERIPWRLAPLEADQRDWRQELEPTAQGETTSQGRFQAGPLPPGRYVLDLEPAGDGSTYLETLRLVADELHSATYDLHSSTVRGTVRRGEEPAVGFGVTLAPSGAEVGHDTVEISDTDTTDDDGVFELVSWQTGQHVVTVRQGETSASIRLLDLFGTDEEVDFRLPSHPVTGEVVTEDGEPVPEATVALSGPASGGASVMKVTTTDEAGRFEAFWDLDSEIELQAMKKGFATSPKVGRRVNWAEPGPPVRLTLERRTTLVGRVVGPRGEGLPGVQVWKVAQTDVPRVVGEATTGPDGAFEIVNPAAGEAGSLWVSGPGCPLVSASSPGLGEPTTIQCVTAPGVLVLHLAQEGDTPAPLVGRRLLLRRDTETARTIIPEGILARHLAYHGLPATSDGAGTLVLLLAPGRYALYLAGSSSAESIARDLPHGYLGEVRLDPGVTVEMEAIERPQ